MSECRIRILDDEVASQIAAGEVVERPSSVVKELLENAVDAGATRVAVEVEDGGRRVIRVVDNGCGMSAQEAVLALQRHATSKIARAEDLSAVRTLGFRGEALPSVASVARLTLLTRARGEVEGVRVEAEASRITALEPAGVPEGTTVTVRDLFYNTPARLKFLKSTRTELGQVCEVAGRLALGHPEVSVRVLSEGEEILHAPGTSDPRNTVAALYGKDLARELVTVRSGRPGLTVQGYLSRPPLSRPTRSGQHFFVNGRPVRSRTLTHAVDEAYRGTMPSGRFPFVLLQLEVDPGVLDVNVHPAKAEVRFLREWEAHRAVLEALREALAGASPHALPTSAARDTLPAEQLGAEPWLPPATGPEDSAPPLSRPGPALQPPLLAAPEGPMLRPIAQLWESYLLVEGPEGLLIVDQHLAHERILFERLQKAAEAGEAGEPLVTPLTLQLAPAEALAAGEWLPALARVGFHLEAFGRGAFVLRAVPGFVRPGAELSVLRHLLDELGQGRRSGAEGVPETLAAVAACRSAVRKGTRLGMEEILHLLRELAAVGSPPTCPHGCPIMVELSYQELLRRFKRI